MKIFICFLLASIALADTPPPNNGQFFYTDMLYDQGTHTHKINVLVGLDTGNDPPKRLQIVPSAKNQLLSLVSIRCPDYQCKTPHKYDDSNASTYLGVTMTESLDMDYGSDVRYTSLTSAVYSEWFLFHLYKYQRETSFTSQFGSVRSSSQSFSTDYDGYMGLAPANPTSNTYQQNFLV